MNAGRAVGTYVLVLYLEQQVDLVVGRLGRHRLPAGHYVYVGSALNGLQGRIGRHLRRYKTLRWHIDYLLEEAQVTGVYVRLSSKRLECQLARGLAAFPEARVPVKGFGSSDCRCPSHLYWLPALPWRQNPPLALRPWPLPEES